MTPLALALERTKPEFVDVAVMWLDVIADFRRRDDTALETERAQWVFAQLVPPDPPRSEPWSTTYPTSSVGRERRSSYHCRPKNQLRVRGAGT